MFLECLRNTFLLNDELQRFDAECVLLRGFSDRLATVDFSDATRDQKFLAEAVIFKLYRLYESLIRSTFLFYCVNQKTLCGADVVSKLRCPDMATADAILKTGKNYLDWGNVDNTRKMANLVFENGFPIVDMVSPVASRLTDLQRFRNFVAHDSNDAANGFRKSRTQYLKIGDVPPDTVGDLALYKKGARQDPVLRIMEQTVSSLSTIVRSL